MLYIIYCNVIVRQADDVVYTIKTITTKKNQTIVFIIKHLVFLHDKQVIH